MCGPKFRACKIVRGTLKFRKIPLRSGGARQARLLIKELEAITSFQLSKLTTQITVPTEARPTLVMGPGFASHWRATGSASAVMVRACRHQFNPR